MSEVEIHYTRPPGRLTVFRQHIVERTAECVVTLLDEVDIPRPLTADGETILEPGAPVVWFTFPGLWHDIGRFHTRDARFTGFYANILTPVAFVTPTRWETTDLFLDVWLDDRGATLLDADELDAAVRSGAVSTVDASRARVEADALIRAAGAGDWPPGICQRWPIERARAVAHGDGTQGGAAV